MMADAAKANKKPYIVGITGGSCSGKSTIAAKLSEMLSDTYTVKVFSTDSYYNWRGMKTIAPFTRIEYSEHNHPDGVEFDRLYQEFTAAISDSTIDVVLVEGIFGLYFEQIREQLDLKVFVDLRSDERLYRRIKRSARNHGESLDETALRYLDTVRYRHDEFVEPMRWHADVVLNGAWDVCLGVDVVAEYVRGKIV